MPLQPLAPGFAAFRSGDQPGDALAWVHRPPACSFWVQVLQQNKLQEAKPIPSSYKQIQGSRGLCLLDKPLAMSPQGTGSCKASLCAGPREKAWQIPDIYHQGVRL